MQLNSESDPLCGLSGPYATRLVCVVLYPLEVGTIIALIESLAASAVSDIFVINK